MAIAVPTRFQAISAQSGRIITTFVAVRVSRTQHAYARGRCRRLRITGRTDARFVEQMDQIGAHCQVCGAPCDRDSELCDECEAKAEAKSGAAPPKTTKPAGILARLLGRG